MWRSVFLHEFLGMDMGNYQAVPGTFSVSPSASPLRRDFDIPAARLFAREFLRFQLAPSWDDVIGLSGRIKLRLPPQSIDQPVSILRVGNVLQLSLRFDQPLVTVAEDPELLLLAHGVLQFGSTQVELGGVPIPYRRFMELRFDWHTTGQAWLSADRIPVGYHNGIGPGTRVQLTDIVVGDAEPIRRSRLPFFDVGRVFVRALRRPDPLLDTVGLLGDIEVKPDDRLRRCVVTRTRQLLAINDRVRAFIAGLLSQLTAPGEALDGTLVQSIDPRLLRAREVAMRAYHQFAQMADRRDYSQAAAFLTTWTELLDLLHGLAPKPFEAMIHECLALLDEDPECRALGESIIEGNDRVLTPFIDLLEQMADRLRAVVGTI